MVLEYFKRKPEKQAVKYDEAEKSPALTEEDERFLERLTAEAPAPALPERPVVILDNGKKVRGKDAQIALMDGADKVELPASPPADPVNAPQLHTKPTTKGAQKLKDYWGYLPAVPSLGFVKKRNQNKAGDDLHTAATAIKPEGAEAADAEAERKAEEQELTTILDDLNLLAINNRAFSFSKESQKLLDEFTQILKDIVNGVPTAYDDLEKLFTRSDKQLKQTYGNLPPFLQTLVKSLPMKMGAVLAPEALAAASDKPGADAKTLGIDTAAGKGGSSKKKRSRIPSLKTLLGTEGAAAGMLKTILNFLKLRFPAFITGTSVLMSMAVFLLLLVFYYCWKRGRETRLAGAVTPEDASEMEVTESEMEDSAILEKPAARSAQPVAGASRTEALQSVLNQPDPKTVPLPAE